MSYLTEEQAAEKWCPEARLSDAATFNRTGPAANLQCIGSACMMWRWQVTTLDTTTGKFITSRDVADLILAGESDRERFKPAWGQTGYCGLAGNPG